MDGELDGSQPTSNRQQTKARLTQKSQPQGTERNHTLTWPALSLQAQQANQAHDLEVGNLRLSYIACIL